MVILEKVKHIDKKKQEDTSFIVRETAHWFKEQACFSLLSGEF